MAWPPPVNAIEHWTSCFIFAFLLYGCAPAPAILAEADLNTTNLTKPNDASLVRRVFLLGNIGTAESAEADGVRIMLREHLTYADSQHMLVFMGDYTPCCDIADSLHVNHTTKGNNLEKWLELVREHQSEVVFVPGDQDSPTQPVRQPRLIQEAGYIENFLGKENVFQPTEGFPGPVALPIANGITLIVMDTQWWLDEKKIYGDTGEYELREPTDFLNEFKDLLFKYRNDQILVVGHHPLYSNGNYGGRFSLKQHLLPIPIVGSLLPLYRQLVGLPQDMASSRYQMYRQEMLQLIRNQHNLIYAAAHDYNLQYFRKEDRRRVKHHIVSGSASQSRHVSKGRGAAFTSKAQGFMVLEYYEEGSVWLEAWTTSASNPEGELSFRTRLVEPNELSIEKPIADLSLKKDYRDSTVFQNINPAYAKMGKLGRVFFGQQYRDLWATPVKVPVLDLDREAVGLVPIKLGGQSQSVTMRLVAKDDKYFMLRSIDKLPVRSLSSAMRRTFASSIIQDQVAMQHPFGAFVIPHLAEGAGIFHTNPKMVFIPDDPRLNLSHQALSNQIVLFEERPDEDVSHIASFGNATNVIGSQKLMQEINDDNDHRVDGYAFARARLFDMLIADHDRTLDNFRWGAFEPYELNPELEGKARKQGKIYLPIPVDRDKAFSKVDGLFPSLYRILAEPAWQSFGNNYGYLRGLNRKGLPLDRRFASSLIREDWVSIADSMKISLTDEVIESAIRTWPAPVFEIAGDEMIRTLKARRDQLPDVADKYYDVLATVVDVVGSNKHELFEVKRIDDDKTEISVFKLTRDGELQNVLYRRIVLSSETKEIRLYGQNGNDQFVVTGSVKKGPRVIAVGGAGEDDFKDASVVQKGPKKSHFYDIERETGLEAGPETKVQFSSDIDINAYEFEGYKPNLIRPVSYFGSNQDDGLFIGGGVRLSRHGFRKSPHAATHEIMGNYAVRTKAFNLLYRGNFVDVIDNWNLDLSVEFLNPNNIRNFYGLGNDTSDDEESSRFYEARFSSFSVRPIFHRYLDQGVSFSIGPSLEITDVRSSDDRSIGVPQPGISSNSFDQLYFGSVEASIDIQTLDNAQNPSQGFRFNSTLDFNAGIVETSDVYATLSSALTLYMSPSLSPQLTLAVRVGGAHNVGAFPFYSSNTLGGKFNLRGYRSTRFAGRSSFYQNAEIRAEIIDFAGYFGYGTLGVMGFLDNGRVWTDNEKSRTWHQGYGGGIWLNIFDQLLLNNTLGFSKNNRTFTFKLGFLF